MVSVYNIFFEIERERLQQSVPSVSATGHRTTSSSGIKRNNEKHSVGQSVSAGGLQSTSSAITALLR